MYKPIPRARKALLPAAVVGVLVAGLLTVVEATTAQADVTMMTPYGSSTKQAKNPKQCGDVLFVGVRGSDEKDVNTNNKTFGATVQRVRDALRDDLNKVGSNLRIRQTYLDPTDYSAVMAQEAVLDPPGYAKSVNDGAKHLESYLAQQYSKCPSEKWFLAGFSQGSQVLDKTLAALTTDELTRISGVYTVANPWNLNTDNFTHDGTAIVTENTPTGVFSAKLSALDEANRRLKGRPTIPPSLTPRGISYCNVDDPMCNYTNGLSAIAILTAADRLHGKGYYRNDDIYNSIRPLALNILGGSPAPSSTSQPPAVIADAGLEACVITELKQDLGVTTTSPNALQVASLQNLNCTPGALTSSGFQVGSLDGLQYATSLTNLSVSGTLTSLEPMTGSTSLKWLSVTNSPVSDVSPLASMTALTNVALTGDMILDAQPLAALAARGVSVQAHGQLLHPSATTVLALNSLPSIISTRGGPMQPQPVTGVTTANPLFSVASTTIGYVTTGVTWTTPGRGYLEYIDGGATNCYGCDGYWYSVIYDQQVN